MASDPSNFQMPLEDMNVRQLKKAAHEIGIDLKKVEGDKRIKHTWKNALIAHGCYDPSIGQGPAPQAQAQAQLPQAEWCININDQPVPEQPAQENDVILDELMAEFDRCIAEPIPEPLECSICFETIQPTNRTILKCKHEFCSECFGTAMRAPNSGNCPVCRERIIPKLPEPPLEQSSSAVRFVETIPTTTMNRIIDNYMDIRLHISLTDDRYISIRDMLRGVIIPIIDWYRREAIIF